MIVAIIVFLTFLFVFYTLAKDDFVYLRRNVTIEQLFNGIFVGLPVVLLFARIGYILFHPKWTYLNPLVFLIVPYYPGLSVQAGILGAVVFFYFYTKNKKIPSFRFSDHLSLSFLAASAIYFLFVSIEQGMGHHLIAIASISIGILYIIAYFLSRIVFANERWDDGTVSALTIVFQSLFSLLYSLMVNVMGHKVLISYQDIVSVVFLFVSLGIFMRMLLLPQKGK